VYYAKVVDKEGNDVILTFDDDTNVGAGATTNLDSYDHAVEATVGALVSWKLDSKGYVEEFKYVDPVKGNTIGVTAGTAGAATAVPSKDPDIFNDGATNYYVTADTVVWNENAAAVDSELVTAWKNVVNAKTGATLAGAVSYVFDGSKLEYLVVNEAGVTSDVELALFIEKGVNADGETYKLMGTDGSYVTYNVDTAVGTSAAKGDLVGYTLDGDGEFVPYYPVAADFAQNNTAAFKGVLVDRSASPLALIGNQVVTRVVYGTVADVDTDNSLIKLGATTYKYDDEDIVIYDATDTDDLKVIELDDIYEDYDKAYLLETDQTADGKFDVMIVVDR